MGLTLVVGGTRSGKSAHAERLALASGLPVRYVATADAGDAAMAARIAGHVARRPTGWETVTARDELTATAFERRGGRCVLIDGLGTWIAGVMHRAGAFEDPDGAIAAALATVREHVGATAGAFDGPDGAIAAALATVREHVGATAGAFEDPDVAIAAALATVREHVGATAGAFDGPDGAIAAALATVREQVVALATVAAAMPEPTIVVAEHAGGGVLPADATTRAWLDALGEGTQRLSAAAECALLVVAGRPIELDAARSADPDDHSRRQHTDTPADPDDPGLRQHGDALVEPGDSDHAVNVMAGGPPAWLRKALRHALEEDAATYPREDEAVAAIAALHGRERDEIVPCNGAAQALWLLPAALRPRLAACVHPAFGEAEAALRAHGVPVARVPRDPDAGFALDPASVPAAADLVIVGNPASPSGTLDPSAALLALRRPGRIVVVDEAFMDLVPGEPASLVRERLHDVIVIRSLTKSLAIPGLRSGYAVAAAALARRLRAVRPPWSCNALALAALRETARRPEALAAAAARAQEERGDLEARLAEIPGLRLWPAAANFVLVHVPDGAQVAARLRSERIVVRPAGSFAGLSADHLRITARSPEENARLAEALRSALASVRQAAAR